LPLVGGSNAWFEILKTFLCLELGMEGKLTLLTQFVVLLDIY
jgi:hypothetical protein